MEDYEKVYSSDGMAMLRIPINPDFMAWLDHENRTGWIVVRDTPENIAAFNNRFKKTDIPDSVTVYYNEPEYYDLIKDGVDTRRKIKEEKERQEKINNPKVDLNINGKHELIDFLVFNLIDKEEALIEEYSTDLEVSEAQLKAKAKELRRLVDKYLY